MGTLGGNLCNGSPASDTVPALMAFDAQLRARRPRRESTVVPLEEFLLGPGETALRTGRTAGAVDAVPRPRPGTGSAFVKISRVAADLAKASVAAVRGARGRPVVDCRLAFGSVGADRLRARKAEALLIGKAVQRRTGAGGRPVASEEISPIDDVRSTAWYRREVVKALTHDAPGAAWERGVGSARRGSRGPGARARGRLAEPATHACSPPRMTTYEIELTVNGEQTSGCGVKPNDLLLNVLRERLELTGTKYGCGIGECGACTVLLNGQPALACLVLAIAADGSEVLTVEGCRPRMGRWTRCRRRSLSTRPSSAATARRGC